MWKIFCLCRYRSTRSPRDLQQKFRFIFSWVSWWHQLSWSHNYRKGSAIGQAAYGVKDINRVGCKPGFGGLFSACSAVTCSVCKHRARTQHKRSHCENMCSLLCFGWGPAGLLWSRWPGRWWLEPREKKCTCTRYAHSPICRIQCLKREGTFFPIVV